VTSETTIDLAGTPFALAADFCVRGGRDESTLVTVATDRRSAVLTVTPAHAAMAAFVSPAPCVANPYAPAGAVLRLDYAVAGSGE
jgi:hypothetical protein